MSGDIQMFQARYYMGTRMPTFWHLMVGTPFNPLRHGGTLCVPPFSNVFFIHLN